MSVVTKYGKNIDMKALGRTVAWRVKTRSAMIETTAKAHVTGMRTQCPICGGSELQPYADIYTFTYVTCASCGHLFYEQIVADEDIASIYEGDSDYLNMQVTDDDDTYTKRLQMIAKPQMEFISAASGKEPQKRGGGGGWLDIACGGCQLLYAAKMAGWKVRGIETGKLGVAIGEKLGIPVVNSFLTAENIQELLGNPDIVSLMGFLEHLADPVSFLASVTSRLTSGVCVALGLPRHPSVSAFATFLFPDLATRHLVVPDHIHIFSDASLEVMIRKASLETIGLWKFGQDFFELVSMMTMKAGREIDVWPENLPNAINELQAVLDRYNLSDYVLAVCRKL